MWTHIFCKKHWAKRVDPRFFLKKWCQKPQITKWHGHNFELIENVKYFRYGYIIRSNEPWRQNRFLIFDEFFIFLDYVSSSLTEWCRIIFVVVRRHTLPPPRFCSTWKCLTFSKYWRVRFFQSTTASGPVRNHGQFLHSIITKSDVVIFIIMGMRL